MKIIEYARSRKLDIQEASIQLEMYQTVETSLTEQIEEDLKVL
jgi:hypothetical protein